MTIDEAIAHEIEVAKEIYVEAMLCHANPDDGELDDCIQRGKYHEQLAEWLEELKAYREIGTVEECKNSILDVQKEYNKAIDDFVKALQEKIEKDLSNPDLALECKKCGIWKNYDIAEIAEQLKAGGNIELSEHSKSQGNRTGKQKVT